MGGEHRHHQRVAFVVVARDRGQPVVGVQRRLPPLRRDVRTPSLRRVLGGPAAGVHHHVGFDEWLCGDQVLRASGQRIGAPAVREHLGDLGVQALSPQRRHSGKQLLTQQTVRERVPVAGV